MKVCAQGPESPKASTGLPLRRRGPAVRPCTPGCRCGPQFAHLLAALPGLASQSHPRVTASGRPGPSTIQGAEHSGQSLPSRPLTTYRGFPASCFEAGPVAGAGACARLRENPPRVVEASALRGLLFRNMSQGENPMLSSPWHRGVGVTGLTLDIALAVG